MKNIHTREQLDALAQKMVGLKLAEVVYYEIEDNEPGYLYKSDVGHFLDFGLDLVAEDGSCFSILWDSTFFQFGIGIHPHSAAQQIRVDRSWVVTKNSEWTPFTGKTIKSAEIFWSWMDVSEWTGGSEKRSPKTRIYYPQDLVLTFGNDRRVYISASQWWEESQQVLGLSDNILVVFRDRIAAQHKLAHFVLDS